VGRFGLEDGGYPVNDSASRGPLESGSLFTVFTLVVIFRQLLLFSATASYQYGGHFVTLKGPYDFFENGAP